MLVTRVQTLELTNQQISPFFVEMNLDEVVFPETDGYPCRHLLLHASAHERAWRPAVRKTMPCAAAAYASRRRRSLGRGSVRRRSRGACRSRGSCRPAR